MRSPIPCLARAVAVILLAAPSAPMAAPPDETLSCAATDRTQDPHPPKCCFTNPGFSGTCEVQPAQDETCASILGYLNNPMSQGKSYCGNTTLRGGWTSASCAPKQ